MKAVRMMWRIPISKVNFVSGIPISPTWRKPVIVCCFTLLIFISNAGTTREILITCKGYGKKEALHSAIYTRVDYFRITLSQKQNTLTSYAH